MTKVCILQVIYSVSPVVYSKNNNCFLASNSEFIICQYILIIPLLLGLWRWLDWWDAFCASIKVWVQSPEPTFKSQMWQHQLVNTALKRETQANLWGSLANQPSWISAFQLKVKLWLKTQKVTEGSLLSTHPTQVLQHTYMDMHILV